jgi:hypothetical protein
MGETEPERDGSCILGGDNLMRDNRYLGTLSWVYSPGFDYRVSHCIIFTALLGCQQPSDRYY